MISRSQRERLLESAMRVVAKKGYGASTVADLTREAEVSRTTFYELFDDKEGCFLAAYDNAADALIRRITAAFEAQAIWPEAMGAALETGLAALSDEPALARVALVDFGAAGPGAQQRFRAVLKRLTPMFDEGRDFAPGGRELPPNTSRMAIGGVLGLITEQVTAGRGSDLAELLAEALVAALSPYLGRGEAERWTKKVTVV